MSKEHIVWGTPRANIVLVLIYINDLVIIKKGESRWMGYVVTYEPLEFLNFLAFIWYENPRQNVGYISKDND